MRKIHHIALILTFCGVLLALNSCEKQPGVNELGDKIIGAWFCEYDETEG